MKRTLHINMIKGREWGRTLRWRGRLPIPPHAHPLVRRLYEIANRDKTTLSEIALRAGMREKTISDWRSKCSPNVTSLEACLNVLGYELHIRPIPYDEKPSVNVRDSNGDAETNVAEMIA